MFENRKHDIFYRGGSRLFGLVQGRVGILVDVRILCIPQYTIVKTAMILSNTVNTGINYREEEGYFLF